MCQVSTQTRNLLIETLSARKGNCCKISFKLNQHPKSELLINIAIIISFPPILFLTSLLTYNIFDISESYNISTHFQFE